MPWIVLNGWLHDSAIVKRKWFSLVLKTQSERKQDSLPFIVNMPSENDPKLSQIRHLLRELLTGQEDPEGFFCLCISILGDSETRMQFRELISPVSYNYRQLHSQLITLYEEYFSKVKTMTVIWLKAVMSALLSLVKECYITRNSVVLKVLNVWLCAFTHGANVNIRDLMVVSPVFCSISACSVNICLPVVPIH